MRRNRTRAGSLLLGLVVLFLPYTAFHTAQGQQFVFEALTVADGLSNNRVTAVLQDQRGFLWFGTEDGLNRYDGYDFTSYWSDPSDPRSLSHSSVSALYEDASGVLWVGTRDGLNRFDPATQSFTRYRHDPNDVTGLRPGEIWSLYQDQAGRLWVGTYGGGLNLFLPETETFVAYQVAPDDPSSRANRVSAICEDRAGRLWVGTDGGGLYHFVPASGTFTLYPHYPDVPVSSGENVFSLLPDEDGGVWVGRYREGIDYFDPETGAFTHYEHALGTRPEVDFVKYWDLAKGPEGRLWIGSTKGLGVLGRAAGTITQYQHDPLDPASLSPGEVLGLHWDAAGMLWIGTNGGGISTAAPGLSPLQYSAPLVKPDGRPHEIQALLESRAGRLWLGTTEGRLLALDRQTGILIYDEKVAAGDDESGIMALGEDAAGAIWVSIWDQGVARLDPATGALRRYRHDPDDPASLSDNTVLLFFVDRQGRLWIGTDSGGLNRYDPRRDAFVHYRQQPGEVPALEFGIDFVLAFTEDPDGTYWIGTMESGLVRFDPLTETATYYRPAPQDPRSLPGATVQALHVDRQGRLWMGLRGQGLVRFDRETETFSSYRIKDGLASDFVHAILEDAQGRLWLGTNRGLTRFDPQTESFRNLDLSLHAVSQIPSGELLFSTGTRFARLSPEQIDANTYAPPVVITALERVSADSLSGTPTIDRTVYLKDEIALSYKDRILTFEVAALSYYQNEKNRYAYQLAGFSNQWIELGTQRRFSFTSLEPGRYTLAVRGSNNDGVWGETTRLHFTITPPWWQTAWAYAAGFLLAGLLAAGLIRNQMNRLRLQNRLELEQVRAESLRNLDLAKSRFFANISHEFRTPLLLILGPLEDMQDGSHGELPPETHAQVKLAARNGHRLLGLVNQLLDVSRLEAGRLVLQARQVDATAFLTRLAEPFAAMAARKPLDFRVELPVRPLPVYLDPDQFEKVVANLLSNAFKFTPPGGAVTLSVTTTADPASDGWFIVAVHDTGPGIGPEHLPHIFERFYQADASSTRRQPGTGIGLALAMELVGLHHGEIRAESEEGVGSTFTVRLPLGRVHLADDELAPPEADRPPVQQEGAGRTFLPPDDLQLELTDASGDGSLATTPTPTGEDVTTVLLVDDNADVRAYLRRRLAPHYRIVEAADGQAALETARRVLPDLIVSDVMMPEMDGYAFCRALKADPALDFIPVILLTAKASEESMIAGLEKGADDYLTKPFNARELELRVHNLIEARRRLKARFRQEVIAASSPLLPAGGVLRPDDAPFAEQFRAALQAHLSDETLTGSALADAVGVSRATLYRRVQEIFDASPMELVWRLRLEQAARWLREPDANVSEVAYGVGFRSISHFSTRFSDHFGTTPSAYRADAHRDA